MTLEQSFLRLRNIMDELREKCPWDKKQTFESLRTLTLEEVYELAQAIDEKNFNDIKEELGDVLLHIIFYSRLGEEQQQFTLQEVIDGICSKLIKRHPHIYGDVVVSNEDDVKKNWEKIKMAEGKTSVLSGVPASLPVILKAIRIQEKARQVGFEWDYAEEVWDKVSEELDELHEAVNKKQQQQVEEEFGDVLFSLINYARFLKIDAEAALEKTNRKFIYRFKKMEAIAQKDGRQLTEMSLSDMNTIWNQVKNEKQTIDPGN